MSCPVWDTKPTKALCDECVSRCFVVSALRQRLALHAVPVHEDIAWGTEVFWWLCVAVVLVLCQCCFLRASATGYGQTAA